MDTTILKLKELFALNRDAVLGVAEERIIFSNPAATSIFAKDVNGLYAREVVPAYILEEEADSFVSSAMIMGKPVSVSASYFDGILVLVINPTSKERDSLGFVPIPLITSLRSSVFNLRMAADRIMSRVDTESDPKLSTYASMLYHSYYNMLRLTENMATVNCIAHSSLSILPTTTDMTKLFTDLIKSVSLLIADYRVQLKFVCDDDKIIATVDREKTEQLLLNLISNSLLHINDEGEITITLKAAGDQLIISVDDTGAGISQETLRRIFLCTNREFTLSEIANGAGLGLSIAKGIAELHGGALIIESRHGTGTSVRVMLPLKQKTRSIFRETTTPYESNGMSLILRELSCVLSHKYYDDKYVD